MVYYRNWDSFVAESSKLYEASPAKTRYCTKWRHELGLLVLKVTDDSKCLKFKTRSAVYLNRFEIMTRTMMQQMHNAKPVHEPGVAAKAGTDGKLKESSVASGPPPLSSTSKDAGKQPPASKKKKGKKKK
ncbi:hypothetical protein PCANC_00209 [Puccinia coronata f. sp. avenae]|uniref:SRP9 domain-containing protein n=1 Tax=Puccinia coronata f. sp. avenae TaxID=200324 RepID=A0A2N5SZY9_9BASI|nr:hypothetical protein PCASD_21052 [Puccinia coronata f. sp. avenae]PLW18804.1 hypothetical protein PCANC_06654 [Puccinia coronata f. sp. avenae]PLW33673.1 hypothetical protein PCASD_10323 [Puccinia coronata f. sp. avenae]PLW58494.1 hypothetical protein PCANC_00209 [Puccinia coronata f. sp. avenae]